MSVLKILQFLKLAKVNTALLSLSGLLFLCFSLFAMYAVCLLFPMVHGIIEGDFTHIRQVPGVDWLVRQFPDTFNTSISLFILLVIWTYFVTVIKNVFHYLASLTIQIQVRMAVIHLRQMLVEKCLRYGKKFYDQNTLAYLQSVFFKSTGLIESQFGLLQKFITQFLLVCVYIIVMFMISWKLALIACLAFPVTNFLTRRIIQKIRSFLQEHDRLTKGLNEKIYNMLYCMPVIKSFSKEEEEIKRFSAMSTMQINEAIKTQRMMSLIAPIEDMGTMTSFLCVAIGLVLFSQIEHLHDASKIFVFFYLAIRIIPGLGVLNHFKLGFEHAMPALRDIKHVLNQDESMVVKGGKEPFNEFKHEIVFNELSFQYGLDEPKVLDRVSFSLKKGERLAIVGPSGSGKSTLVNLLLRFYDCAEKSIFVDGKDIREYNVAMLRKNMAYVSQEALLFNDSIRNNILYGASGDNTDEMLREIGSGVDIHELIEQMPDKYDTLVGEKGGRLSGGERQRLTIARALIKDAGILILDEASSALDSTMEEKINEFLMQEGKDKTTIIIAHRLSTIKRADKIIYLEKGRIKESGSLQELIDKKGFFYKQWLAQQV